MRNGLYDKLGRLAVPTGGRLTSFLSSLAACLSPSSLSPLFVKLLSKKGVYYQNF